MTNTKILRLMSLLILIVSFSSNIFAAGDADTIMHSVAKVMTWFTIILILFVLWLALVYSQKNDNNGAGFKKAINKAIYVINPMPALEREKDIMLDHDYDGIKELDNVVPPWFNFLFYGSIVFSIIYMVHFHIIDDTWSQEREYREEMEVAEQQHQILVRSGAFIDESSVKLLTDEGAMASGKEVYTKHCVSCHAADGGGLVGPNLTDKYWIHGGGIKNVFKTIKYGVPDKGMIPWQTQLSPKEMAEVASYILEEVQNMEPANPKAPEGEIWKPETKEKEKTEI